jgi:hypothetical protein
MNLIQMNQLNSNESSTNRPPILNNIESVKLNHHKIQMNQHITTLTKRFNFQHS